MSRETPKLPSEAIELYNRYIHGEITRRDLLQGAKRFAMGGLTLETLIDALMPNYTYGQQVSKTDDRRLIAELRPLGARTGLRFGSDEGRITISNDFDARLRDMQKYGG